MAALGPNDAIILVLRSWQPHRPHWMSETNPLRISAADIQAGFEGNTTHGRVSLWNHYTWRNGSAVQVYVYFGSPRPSRGTVCRVQHELDAARFPKWSMR
jgi:hypothetical protein